MSRRLLLVLLSLLIPLKIAAAAVVPIVGMPAMMVEHNTAHRQHAAVAADHGSATDDACCPDHVYGAGSDRLHDHGCPHLAMSGPTGVLPALPMPHFTPQPPAEPVLRFVSVILEVLLPPPTGLA
jgi:hypothetical protein